VQTNAIEASAQIRQRASGPRAGYFGHGLVRLTRARQRQAAIATWRDDMNHAQSDLIGWVQVGVKWQITQASSADLGGRGEDLHGRHDHRPEGRDGGHCRVEAQAVVL
jgi:hypothetical protein